MRISNRKAKPPWETFPLPGVVWFPLFYSKLISKTNIFPALGFSSREKYLLVVSQGPQGLPNRLHVWHRDLPPATQEELDTGQCRASPQSSIFPPENGAKTLWGHEKTSPARKASPGVKRHRGAAGSSRIRSCQHHIQGSLTPPIPTAMEIKIRRRFGVALV